MARPGRRGRSADLPLPALIDVDLAPGADPAAVAAAVKRAVPSARFIAHQTRLAPMLGTLTALQSIAALIVLLIALATAAAVVLATRGALDTHRATIEVMHGIGATDDQVTRLFQRKIALDALIGGTAGRSSPRSSCCSSPAAGSARSATGPRAPAALGRSRPARTSPCSAGSSRRWLRGAPCLRHCGRNYDRPPRFLLVILYALGFALFAVTLGKPAAADAEPTQAIVVLTGGKWRIEHAAKLLDAGQGQAPADRRGRSLGAQGRSDATPWRQRKPRRCCVDLGSESVDTRSNADEAMRWLERRSYTSLRLVTSDWHMHRARYEFRHPLGKRVSHRARRGARPSPGS